MKAVEVKDLVVGVNGYTIINGFDLNLDIGEVVLIAGPPGSGKTTLLKVIAGIIPYLYSKYNVKGIVRVLGLKPHQAVEKGLIAYVPQDPVTSTVTPWVIDNHYLVRPHADANVVLPTRSNRNIRVDQLSIGQFYKLLSITALDSNTKLLLLDEPTSHLDAESLEEFMELARNLALTQGLTILLVDHRVKTLEKYVDYTIYMSRYKNPTQIRRRHRTPRHYGAEVLLEVMGVSIGYNEALLEDVNLVLKRGEIILVYGRNGVGKTTLAKTIVGILEPLKGEIRVNGKLFYIPQTPIYWFSHGTVREELEFYYAVNGKRVDLNQIVETIGIEGIIGKHTYTLSIGEARLLSIALALASGADIIVLDEPLIGLDNYEALRLIDTLLDIGKCGVLVLSHSKLFYEIADRVYVVKGRKLVEDAS